MRSFQPGFLDRVEITHGMLRTMTAVAERKGRIQLFREQAPQVLETLRQAALIESTESSNRIEGVTAAPERLRALMAERTVPRDRSEQEIAGYRDVLATVHANHPYIAHTPNVVMQLHRDLYQFTTLPSGKWKSVDNSITEVRPDGSRVVRFEPVPAFQTADAMRDLHEAFNAQWERGEVEPLILIAAYVLDFLCIHPFLDGNGRMARLLTLRLLYRAEHDVGRYVSLERLVETSKEGYYDALYASSQGWHEGRHTLRPWLEYFVGVVVFGAYLELEARVGAVTTGRGAKREMVRDTVLRLPSVFRYADVERACPGVSRPTINRGLRQLRQDGIIRCVKPGRDALWVKGDHD